MAQILVPTSDIATGSWSSTPLWSKVDDDSTVNASGDGTTIASDNNTSPDTADLGLAAGTDPSSSTDHILRARWNKSASGGHQIDAILHLVRESDNTTLASLSVTNIGETEVESTYTLTGTEADSITDYADLMLRVIRSGDTGGAPNGRRSLVVDLVELEIPDASTAKEGTGSASLSVTISGQGSKVAKATGTSSMAVSTSGTAKAIRKATGLSNLVTTTSGSAKKAGKATGTSSLALTSSASGSIPSQTKSATGSASLSVSTSGTSQRTAKGSGSSSVSLTTTADSQRTAVVTGSASLVLSTTATPHRIAKATVSAELTLTVSGQGDNASVESTFDDLRQSQVAMLGPW